MVSRVLVGMSTVGVAFSGWLTYLEAFVIHAYCMWCLISAAIVSTIFVASVSDWLDYRRRGAERASDAVGQEPLRRARPM